MLLNKVLSKIGNLNISTNKGLRDVVVYVNDLVKEFVDKKK